jgi:hypothetical protein
MQSPQLARDVSAELDSWEIQALGQHGTPVLQRIEQLKNHARRLAGRNEGRCFQLLFEERLLNDLIVDMTSAYLDLERIANHIQAGKYKVGETHTDLYRAIVH